MVLFITDTFHVKGWGPHEGGVRNIQYESVKHNHTWYYIGVWSKYSQKCIQICSQLRNQNCSQLYSQLINKKL